MKTIGPIPWVITLVTTALVGAMAIFSDRKGATGSNTPTERPTADGPPPTLTPEAKRLEVVRIAGSQLGKDDASPYWVDAFGSYPGKSLSWCGVFALWVYRQAGLTTARWILGKGFIYPEGLKQTMNPQPGDVAYFDRNQHQAIVASVQGDSVTLINGNGTAGAVTESTVKKTSVTAFFSIDRWL